MAKPAAPSSNAANPGAEGAALLEALRTLLLPLARLAVARGLPVRDVEEQLRGAFVAAAREAQPAGAPARQVSRIATATGLTRREVTRLLDVPRDAAPSRRSPATEVFARWIAEPSLRDAQARPRPLPRQGAEGSFEALARSVTRDVHPRSLLDELCRLGLAQWRQDDDTVLLAQERFVPREDRARLLGLLGHNVGDHLQAAVENVLSGTPPHLEQAVFADELSERSVEEVRALVRGQWQALVSALVPELHRLIAADRDAGRPQNQRVRIGLYGYGTATEPSSTAGPAEAPSAARRAKRSAATPPSPVSPPSPASAAAAPASGRAPDAAPSAAAPRPRPARRRTRSPGESE